MPRDDIFDVLAAAAGRLAEYFAVWKPPVDLYVCDLSDVFASKVSKDTGGLTPIPDADFAFSIAADAAGNVYLAEPSYEGILKFPADGGPRVTVARRIVQPYSVTVDWTGNVYFYGKTFDAGSNSKLVKIPVDGGPPEELWSDTLQYDRDIAVDSKANLYLLGENPARVLVLPANGGSPTSFEIPGMDMPMGLAVDPFGRHVYITDNGANQVVKVPVGGGGSVTIGGDFFRPAGVAVDVRGSVYVADMSNNRVVQVFANSGRQVTVARTKWPLDVALAPQPVGPYVHKSPDLVGWVHGAAAEGGNGWLVIGKRFIPIPPRSPVMDIIAHAAAPYAARAVEDAEMAAQLDRLQPRQD